VAFLRNKSRRFARVLLLAALFASKAVAGAVETEHLDRQFECLESLGPELVNQFAIARADLETISAQAGWTAEQKAAVTDWLNGLLPTEAQVPLPAPQNIEHPIGSRIIFMNAERPHHLPAPMEAFAVEVVSRLRAFDRLGSSLTSQAVEAVAAIAEKTWLEPSQPGAIQQTLKVIERLRRQFPMAFKGSGGFGLMRSSFPEPMKHEGRPVVMFGDDAFTAGLLLSGPEPLLVPAPEVDPAGYVRACLQIQQLKVWNLSFLQRPAVHARLYAYQMRFADFPEQARAKLDMLFHQQASTDVLLQAGARLEGCRVPTEKPMNSWRGASIKALPYSTVVSDFHPLLNTRPNNINPVPTPPPVFSSPMHHGVLDAYKAVMLALEAEKNPGKSELSTLRSIAMQSARQFHPSVQAALEQRWGASMAPAPPQSADSVAVKIAADAPSYEAVAEILQTQARQRGSNAGDAASTLLLLWEGLKRGSSPPMGVAEGAWPRLAGLAGSVALFTARDRVMRELLVKAGEPAGNELPLQTLLREKLERATSVGDSAEVERVLALAQVATELPPHEMQEWRQAAVHFQAASQFSKAGSVTEARRSCMAALRGTTNPVIGASAARFLKHLSAPPPAP
jgi:hypothetical protein